MAGFTKGEENEPGYAGVDWEGLAMVQMKVISQAEGVIVSLLAELAELRKSETPK